MNTPLVSIIVPAYNYANFILETLKSIQEQTYINWEAIVVDDGSTDGTKELVKTILETDSRVKYIYQTNKGLPAARNTGIKASLGDYIQFLDADDLLSKYKIELQVEYMLENSSSDISYTTAHYFKHPDISMLYADINLGMRPWMPKINGSGNIVLEKLIDINIMPVNCALIKRELFDTIGYQNEDLKCLEDWEYWLRCAFGGATFNFVEDINAYALIRIHSSSMSRNILNMLMWELNIRSVLPKFIDFSTLPAHLKKTIKNKNNIREKKLYKRFIANSGLLNWKNVIVVYQKYSIITFLLIYFKAIKMVLKKTERLSSDY